MRDPDDCVERFNCTHCCSKSKQCELDAKPLHCSCLLVCFVHLKTFSEGHLSSCFMFSLEDGMFWSAISYLVFDSSNFFKLP